MRPASAGAIATIARRARTASAVPPSAPTDGVHAARPARARSGAPARPGPTRRRRAARRGAIGTSCEPPTKRSCWAPPAVSNSRSSRRPSGRRRACAAARGPRARRPRPPRSPSSSSSRAGAGGDVAAHPGRDGLPSQRGGLRRAPRRVERHLARHPVEPALGLRDVGEHGRVDPRDRARGSGAGRRADSITFSPASGSGRSRCPARAPARQPVLRRPDPLAADLDDLAVAESAR